MRGTGIRWTVYVWPDGDVTWRAWRGWRTVGSLHRQLDGTWLAVHVDQVHRSKLTLREAAIWLVGGAPHPVARRADVVTFGVDGPAEKGRGEVQSAERGVDYEDIAEPRSADTPTGPQSPGEVTSR